MLAVAADPSNGFKLGEFKAARDLSSMGIDPSPGGPFHPAGGSVEWGEEEAEGLDGLRKVGRGILLKLLLA